MFWARIGAILYVIWGLLHIGAAVAVHRLAQTAADPVIEARVEQTAAYLLAIAIAAIVVALRSNWRNTSFGYWFNAVLVTVADIPFVALVVVPGHIPLAKGLPGPVTWVLALIATTVAYRRAPRGS